MNDHENEPDRAQIEAMFVQTARWFQASNDRLTLRGLAPATLYFSDRPRRVVGHIANHEFIDLWSEGDNSFSDDPPNAVLSFLEEADRAPEDAVLMLLEPSLTGDELTYRMRLLESSLPSTAGPCTLFIDPLGMPLSPVSVAGVHRRAVRRERRRLI